MIDALLIDLDGTIFEKNKILPRIKETIQWIQKKSIPFKFCTNNSRQNRNDLLIQIKKTGINIKLENIITPSHAAIMYCKKNKINSIQLVMPDKSIYQEFYQFNITTGKPDAIILGDMGEKFNHTLLTDIFNKIINGAELISMHKNRYWIGNNGFTLDIGPFVAALEYATGKSATIVGKPSKDFFKMAINDWDFPKKNILMIGDDIKVDIKGAIDYGIKGAIVKTGKFMNCDLEQNHIRPDYIFKSLAEIKMIFN